MFADMPNGRRSDMERKLTLRILLVDDDHDTVEVFQRILMQDGHDVTTAEGFDDALTLAQFERFDVLFCDLGLPEHDGYELLAKVKSRYPIRAIAMTGDGMPDDVKRAAEAGFDDFLLKPVDIQRLRSVLEGLAVQIELDGKREKQAPMPSGKYPSPWHI
jgi:CheY-like chemotaxis protein